ncbi:MAG: hypothetical protein UX81_C0043G0010 [Parcubacteria group bacterium GW2011_GWA2_47_12]|nr:MAG: hypothetical protein UX81_C0043G0010 [Parcubacteria group bacterium GW2011_GWA2_47_12]
MEKINGNEILGSIHEAIKERFFSPFYGTFIISWLIFHWKFVYTAFFVSEEKIWESAGLLKNDYLSETFFDFSSLHFYISWILPFVLTYLIIWRFPKWISIPAFREDLDNITKKQKMLITAEKELEIQQVAKVDVVVERVRKETEVKQAEKKIKQVEGEIKKIAEETKPEQKWIFEYQRFKSLPVYNKFEIILKSIYQHRGEINVTNNNNQIIFQIPQDILAFSHTNDLIDFDKQKEKIELTEKGKFFVKEFSSEKGHSF